MYSHSILHFGLTNGCCCYDSSIGNTIDCHARGPGFKPSSRSKRDLPWLLPNKPNGPMRSEWPTNHKTSKLTQTNKIIKNQVAQAFSLQTNSSPAALEYNGCSHLYSGEYGHYHTTTLPAPKNNNKAGPNLN